LAKQLSMILLFSSSNLSALLNSRPFIAAVVAAAAAAGKRARQAKVAAFVDS
jgi:hypothetical protein